jgi:hypothetical protein
VQLGGHGGGLVELNSPEMEIASNKTTKVGPKFKTTNPKEAHLVYVKLGGHGGGLRKPNSPEMEAVSHKLAQNSRQQPPE